MATKNKTRRRASKARRAAAKARDAELAAMGLAMLEAPDIGERIAALVDTPRMLTYSLRNQALLLGQADERGLTVTDVDTYKGWWRRGRQVRAGEHGLKIVRPFPERRREPTNDLDPAEDPDADSKIRFRTMTVFDLSQTDELAEADDTDDTDDCEDPFVGTETDPEPDVEPSVEAEPETVLVDSLREQAERAGYLVLVFSPSPARSGSVDVDHQAQTITVYDDGDRQTLSRFAGAVAAILAAQAKTKANTVQATH